MFQMQDDELKLKLERRKKMELWMESRIVKLNRELETLLSMAPVEDDCSQEENEVVSDIANLINSIYNAGYPV